MGTPPNECVYGPLIGSDDKRRACDEISDEACIEAPRNAALNLGNGTAPRGDRV